MGVSGGLEVSSDFMCKELQLGLGDKSLVVFAIELTPLGDCDGSRVRLLTKALVSLWFEPRLCDVPPGLSAIPPDTKVQKRKLKNFVIGLKF